MSDPQTIDPVGSPVIDKVLEQSARVLETYRVDPGLVQEHANNERRITQGGYGDRQLFELVQNAADEIAAKPAGKLEVVLTGSHLYCANEGSPVTPEGAETILRMSVSRKRGGQIGRFGVGVKSVLSISNTPQFFSSSGSFGFDRFWSAQKIAEVLGTDPDDLDAPVLRMARPLDVDRERSDDPVLDRLLQWATTVVRLPLLDGAADRLGHDIAGHRYKDGRTVDAFPAGFQLFSSHVGAVLLTDARGMPRVHREITVRNDGIRRTIRETKSGAKHEITEWKVYSVEHAPTAEARSSAGELHDRGVIDVSWAVPEYTVRDGLHTVPPGRGEFWSYFPTKYPVSLTGYINAAWKTNEDRQNLLDGSGFNRELLQVAARLVVDSLPRLSPPDDPGAYLPLLPGRANEFINWADDYLLRQIWQTASQRPSLPDQNGVLRVPGTLHVHPRNLDRDWLAIWSEYPGRPVDWVHRSVDATDLRHGKMEHILGVDKQKAEDVKTWLEALVADHTPEASSHAIRILSAMVARDRAERRTTDSPLTAEARQARIVLTESHGMVAPGVGKVYHRTSEDSLRDDMVYVDARISDRPEMGRHLLAVGIRVADAQGRFQGVLDQGFAHYTRDSWSKFWLLMRSAGGNTQVERIRAKLPNPLVALQVRTVDGQFRPMRDCMLPGPVVPADGSRDESVAVDMGFHADDLPLFRDLGLTDRPTAGHRPDAGDVWFEDYQHALHEQHLRTLPPGSPRTSRSRLTVEGAPMAGPLHLFPHLSPEGRAAFVAAMPDAAVVESWNRRYGTQSTVVASPLRWLVNKYGLVRTSQGLTRIGEAVGPQLKEYAGVLPVAEISPEKARRLRMPTMADEVPSARWSKLLDRVLESEDDAFVGRAYALLLRVGMEFPEEVETRCRIGSTWGFQPDGKISVATSEADYKELMREGLPGLLVADKSDAPTAKRMVEEWGMLKVSDVISKTVRKVPSAPPVSMLDEYPILKARLGNSVQGRRLQRCSELEQTIRTPAGGKSIPLTAVKQGHTLLVLDSLDRQEVLEAADTEFGWNIGVAGCRQVIEAQIRQEENLEVRGRLRRVREAESVIDKISLLIGDEQLRGELPPGLVASEVNEKGEEPDARRIAEMAFNAHGESILRIHARDLAVDFPGVAPTSFTGNSKARQFVADLGFPDSFAGATAPTLEPRVEVDGPSEFPALHDYQEQLARGLFQLLDNRTPQRGMLSLPTGAGKTRVTAEGVIRWIRERGNPNGPVLWIAQTEELCEQAVQSWKFVWSKVGAEVPLAISRLWSSNEATPVDGRPHLVVATDAKLQICLASDNYDWLRDTALVIVDEAHVAISRRYTEILEGLGLTHQRTGRHLVGLTATPYRNNEELTRRLVQRFGTRLDAGVFNGDLADAIGQLQSLGVLAEVRHRELAGATIQLNADELSRSQQFAGLLPKGAEQRLADDPERNQRIVDEIAAMPADWPVLVFATSVAHAKFLAAKLEDRDIRASAIDSATPTAERRKKIDDFRRGRIRVITNYGVLTQGFDAPATRAVVVARPTYSANIYQQMIGRGLRGPRNGGKETCLILNVRDNITNYGESLAFTQFEYLWQAGK